MMVPILEQYSVKLLFLASSQKQHTVSLYAGTIQSCRPIIEHLAQAFFVQKTPQCHRLRPLLARTNCRLATCSSSAVNLLAPATYVKSQQHKTSIMNGFCGRTSVSSLISTISVRVMEKLLIRSPKASTSQILQDPNICLITICDTALDVHGREPVPPIFADKRLSWITRWSLFPSAAAFCSKMRMWTALRFGIRGFAQRLSYRRVVREALSERETACLAKMMSSLNPGIEINRNFFVCS